jgi:hypothetical protein
MLTSNGHTGSGKAADYDGGEIWPPVGRSISLTLSG